ncbi:mitochondrial import receptor subunit tom-20 [Terfezia boudieri ATCC MYA-4762]|uniref:Mitochondrial import receptor subunit TOM20 n=1 Tax=Terfezia boudieri ATCC MYA-4762 TaxID=1051890 RepID=A0A3N4L6Q3_9PEZI|nr:mitochondrial import receptor subunit tom-20 [Terfezia boudieri ATCC MYA-4762]
MVQTSTIVATTAVTVITLGAAYAIYFDYRRRHDPEFRKALKRDRKRHARSERAQQAAASAQQREIVAKAVRQVQLEGFPVDVEEKEVYFMQEVAQGEVLCQEGPDRALEAALAFYKALKVYPQPGELISIYDKTVPKHVLDILAEMIATDGSIQIGSVPPREAGLGVE